MSGQALVFRASTHRFTKLSLNRGAGVFIQQNMKVSLVGKNWPLMLWILLAVKKPCWLSTLWVSRKAPTVTVSFFLNPTVIDREVCGKFPTNLRHDTIQESIHKSVTTGPCFSVFGASERVQKIDWQTHLFASAKKTMTMSIPNYQHIMPYMDLSQSPTSPKIRGDKYQTPKWVFPKIVVPPNHPSLL